MLACPRTGDRVFIGTATLQDIKRPPTSMKKKILMRVPSAKVRETLYDELSLCLEDMETRLLPRYGGRPWQVVVRVQDNGQSPFFRWFRGKLEVAALPHILEKIPGPPKFPGYKQTEHGVRRLKAAQGDDSDSDEESVYDNLTEEELQRMESLKGREVSSLSQVAWDHRNDKYKGAPLPIISMKWTCPLRQIFTTRKAAWDHAVELARAEQLIDRYLRGRGSLGVLLKPFCPKMKDTLEAGTARFLRDGLWVVGQEQQWQLARLREIEREKREAEQANERSRDDKEEVEGGASRNSLATKRKRLTPTALFVHVNRHAYKEKCLRELKSRQGKQVKKDPVKERALTVLASKSADKIGLPPAPPKKKAKTEVNKVSFTVRDAEINLRAIFKKLPQKELLSWEAKAESSFHRKLEIDDKGRMEAFQSSGGENRSDDEDEEETGSAEEKSDAGNTIADFSKSEETGGGAHDREESSLAPAVELASEEDRAIWEVFSDAEITVWSKRSMFAEKKRKPPKPRTISEEKDDPEDIPRKQSLQEEKKLRAYEEYQHRVFYNVFNMSKAQYEKYAIKNMRVSDRRKVEREIREQEQLKEQGMRQYLPEALSRMRNRIEKLVGSRLTRELNKIRKGEDRKKEENKKAMGVNAHLTQQHSQPRKCEPHSSGTSGGTEATRSIAKEGPVEQSGTSLLGHPEVAGNSILPVGTTAVPVNMTSRLAAPTPVSPSPTLAEASVRQHQEVKDPGRKGTEETGGIAQDVNVKVGSSDNSAKEPSFPVSSPYCLNEAQIKLCKEACMEHFEAVMRTVKAKDLTRELVDGFDVLRERGRGRYDMELPAFDLEDFSFLTDIQKAPWMPIVRRVLGEEVVLIHKGCFLSLPGASHQNYHQDGTHLHPNSQRPCHAVNVFVPLVDMTNELGPTEFCLGSHILGQEDYDYRFIETPLPKKGFPIMFDYRLGHRGMANISKEPRPIVYCTYARANEGKEFRDSINFSRRRYRKLGEMVEKPLSREERIDMRNKKAEEVFIASLGES